MHALSRIDKLFSDPFFTNPIGQHAVRVRPIPWQPNMDVHEDQEHVYVSVEVPGIPPNQIEASITGNVLTIKGEKAVHSEHSEHSGEHSHIRLSERSYGSFMRKIRLPAQVDSNDISATGEHGVLKISMKKRDLPKKIDISFD